MKKYLQYFKLNWWILFLTLFSLLSLVSEIISGRWSMFDFEVYYRTAQRIINSDEIYRIASDKYYVYKYAPSVGVFFIPFTILPLWLAKIIYWGGITFLLGFVSKKLYVEICNERIEKIEFNQFAIFFALLTILIHVHSELTIGQVNILLLTLYVFLIFTIQKNKQIQSALLLAVSIIIKPFGLIFLPYLIIKKKYKTLLYFCGIILLLIALPLLFYPSFDTFVNLNKAWINELGIELANKQELLASANHTIFSVLARHTPVSYVLTSSISQKIYQILIVVVIGWLFFKLEKGKQSLILEMSVLIILIPLFSATSKNAFIFAMPLALYLISHFKDNSTVVKILTILGCIFIGGNLYEIYGHDISALLNDISIYTLGSILLLTATYIHTKKHQPTGAVLKN